MSVIFEKYKPENRHDLHKMIFSLYKEDPEGESMDTDKINRTIEVLQQHPEKGSIIMFLLDKVVVGYSIIINYWSNEYGEDILHIDELYVKEEYRGRGYSTSFFRYILGRDSAYKAVMLEVTPSNKRVIKYYKSLGFKESLNKHMLKQL